MVLCARFLEGILRIMYNWWAKMLKRTIRLCWKLKMNRHHDKRVKSIIFRATNYKVVKVLYIIWSISHKWIVQLSRPTQQTSTQARACHPATQVRAHAYARKHNTPRTQVRTHCTHTHKHRCIDASTHTCSHIHIFQICIALW